jgi:hypothetical protein
MHQPVEKSVLASEIFALQHLFPANISLAQKVKN